MIAGGVESMSRAPFVMGKAESAFSRAAQIYDTTIGWRFVNPLMKAKYGIDSMPETAENVAADFKVVARRPGRVRAAQPAARRRGDRGGAARRGDRAGDDPAEEGRSDRRRSGTSIRARRRSRRSRKLKGVVRPDGTVTAGNASGVNDGACALLLASERGGAAARPARRGRASSRRRRPASRRASWASARRRRCARCSRKAGLKLAEIDVIELNEAFAAQALAVLRDLGLPTTTRRRQSERRRDRARPSARRERRAAGDDRALPAAAAAAAATRCARCASASGRASR